MSEFVRVRDEGAIRDIRMLRADKKNALDFAMYDALAAALESANAANIRCIVIGGVPGAFCAGNDLKDFQTMAAERTGLGAPILRFLHALARCEKPIVAAVQGVAVGVGTTMLLHCDYVVAGSDARFMTPFVSLGLVPEAASSLLAPRLMGPRRAFALLAMGQPLDADGAKACGLANIVCVPGEVDAEARKAAERIASLPPEALALSRRLVRGSPEEIVARIDEEAAHFRKRLESEEAQAAFKAFFERKK
jgi:enoyl-CoA hydratase/carnithine racemase